MKSWACILGICGAMVSVLGCEGPERLPFEATVCQEAKVDDVGDSCFEPSACCELSNVELENICEQHYPGTYVATMCLSGPINPLRCIIHEHFTFKCSYGDNMILACCAPILDASDEGDID